VNIYALADLHLSLGAPFDRTNDVASLGQKPMAVFGGRWEDHIRRMERAWRETVGEDDLVLVPGDISWAMTLDEAEYDLAFIGGLPGRKILVRGNHDYWWHSVGRVRERLPESVAVIQNDAVLFDDFAVCGSRLWTLPSSPDFKAADESIYKRELIRLEMSLRAAEGRPVIVMTHFMPIGENGEENEVTDLFFRYHARIAVYGHLHDKSHAIAVQGEKFGIRFFLASADYVDFCPRLIASHGEQGLSVQ
jgi:predicted phosphohydrolase